MKKLGRNQKLIIMIALITIIVFIVVLISANVIKTNLANSRYNTSNNNSGNANLIPENIKNGITLGGVTGILKDLDTSDANASSMDILSGKTAYVKGSKVTGTLDTESPQVSFEPNGNTTWSKSQSAVVTVGDNLTSSSKITIKYVWSTSEDVPNFAVALSATNGQKITNNTGAGKMYLYIQAIDEQGNETIARSNQFYLDNQEPVIYSTYTSYKMMIGSDYDYYNYSDFHYNENGNPVMTTGNNDPQIVLKNISKFNNIRQVVISLVSLPNEDIPIQIFLDSSGQGFTANHLVSGVLHGGSEHIVKIDIPKGTYQQIRVDVGNKPGQTFTFSTIDLVADSGTSHNNIVMVHFDVGEIGSGVSEIQYSTDRQNWYKSDQYFNDDMGIRVFYQSSEVVNATYYYRAVDNLGNVSESTQGIPVRVNA